MTTSAAAAARTCSSTRTTTTTSCHGGFNSGELSSLAARAFLLLLVAELVLHVYVCTMGYEAADRAAAAATAAA